MRQTKAAQDETAAPPPAPSANLETTGNGLDEETLSPPDRRAKLRSMRVSQAMETVTGPQVLVYVPCQKPPPKAFVRCHPDPEFAALYYCILDGAYEGDRENYIVADESLAYIFGANVRQVRLITAVTALGSLFLWPLKMPGGGRSQSDSWNQSAFELAERAKSRWLKITTDMDVRAYRGEPATADFGEPRWPEEDFDTIVALAFPDTNIIDSPDHPAVRRFLGREKL